MTMYETIKTAVPVKQAAEHYGLKASRNGMACFTGTAVLMVSYMVINIFSFRFF